MDATRHARIGALYREVRRLPRSEAARLLAQACADDTELLHDVEELLRFAEDGEVSDGFSEAALAESRARLEAAAAGPALDPGWIPEAIGRYRIVRRIGVGGMGAVYEGVQEAPHRRVAVKVLHPLLVTEERVRRFRREVEVLGRLQHPGIAQVYEAGSADLGRGEQPWFAMELVEGVDLRTWAREKALDANARLALVAEVADAVHHAHERGIVHRDLKPDNVLVDASGRPRVLDFGVARVTESSTALSTMETMQGQIVGTLTYMAPEQLAGDPEALSARSDVYALGVIAFELLVGRRPIDAGELPVSAAVPLLLASEATRLGAIDARLSGDVETIVGKALEKDPERRYASAAAFAEDVRRHLAHRPIVARPPSVLYRAAKFTRRHRGLVAGSALALVFLLAGIVGVLRYARGEARARVEAERLSVDARAAGYASIGSLLDQGDVWGARAQLLRTPESARGWEWNWLEARGPLAFPGLEEALMIRSGRVFALWNPGASRFPTSIQVVDIAAPRAPRLEVEGLDGVLGGFEGRFVPGSPVAVEGLLRASRDGNAAPYRGAIGILDLEEERYTDIARLEDPGGYSGFADLRADFPVTTRLAGFREGVLLLAGDGVLPGETAEGWSWVEVRELGPSGSTRRYEVHYPEAQVCALSPDGELALVFPHTDRVGPTVLVRIDGWQELGRIPSGLGRQGPKFRPDGKELATLVREDRIEVYGIPDLDLRRSLEVPSANSLAWFGTDRWVTSGFGQLRVLDAETGAVLEEQRTNQTTGLPGMVPDRGLVAGLGGSSSELTVYELGAPPHGPFRELSGHGQFVYACAWSPDGSLLASAAPWDPEILLWDGWTGELVGRAPRAVDPGESGRMRNFPAPLFFSSAGELVTTEPVERVVRIVRIDVVTGKTSTGSPRRGHFDWNSFQCPPERVADLIECVDSTRARSFGPRLVGHPDGRRVICTSFICSDVDRKVCVRGSRSEDDETSDLHGLGLSLAPDQERLAIGDVGKVHIVSLPGWRELETIEDLGGAEDRYYAVAWSPDGERLAVGSQSGRIQLLETTYFRPILELPPHPDYVYSLAWSPDGTRLASASGDWTLRIHDTVHPIARRLQAEERAQRVAAQAARLEALVEEHGDVVAATQALLAEAGDDEEARIAARRACLLRWNRR